MAKIIQKSIIPLNCKSELALELSDRGLISLRDRDHWTILFPEDSRVEMDFTAGNELSIWIEMPDGQIYLVPAGLVSHEEMVREAS